MENERQRGLRAQVQPLECKTKRCKGCAKCRPTADRIVREHLTDDANQQLTALAKLALAGRDFPTDPTNQLSIAAGFRPVLAAIVPAVVKVAERLKAGAIDAAFFTNLPLDRDGLALFQLSFTMMIGEPFNYASQNGGKLIMELRPAANAGANTNATTDEFDIHTDDAAMPRDARTEFIVLAGVVNPPGTLTGYASTAEALAQLQSSVTALLRQKRFQVRFPISFGQGDDTWSEPVAILSGNDEDSELRFPSYATRPIDPADQEAADAIKSLKTALISVVQDFSIDPGTMLVFNNARGAHRRGAIRNGDRLVLRTYAARTLEFLRRRTGVEGPIFPVNPFIPNHDG